MPRRFVKFSIVRLFHSIHISEHRIFISYAHDSLKRQEEMSSFHFFHLSNMAVLQTFSNLLIQVLIVVCFDSGRYLNLCRLARNPDIFHQCLSLIPQHARRGECLSKWNGFTISISISLTLSSLQCLLSFLCPRGGLLILHCLSYLLTTRDTHSGVPPTCAWVIIVSRKRGRVGEGDRVAWSGSLSLPTTENEDQNHDRVQLFDEGNE